MHLSMKKIPDLGFRLKNNKHKWKKLKKKKEGSFLKGTSQELMGFHSFETHE